MPQLVKNAKNTIIGFRNLLGKSYVASMMSTVLPLINLNRFNEAASIKTSAAPIIDHNGGIAYNVRVLEPPPKVPSIQPTPKGSHAPTPLQSPPPELNEPVYTSKTLTVTEVASIVIGSLVSSAADFLGQAIRGAVITIPSHFSQNARNALRAAAESAGVHVLQLLEDAAAASLAYASLQHPPTNDTLSLVLDLGASGLDLTLLSLKQGLVHVIESSYTPNIGGDAIDDQLVAFFAKDFTKKTKVPLLPTSTDPQDLRAIMKLRLAVEHTKRTLSASPGAASCSVESLKDGLDFSGTINRLRFDIEVKRIYAAINDAVKRLLETAEIDTALLDEVILVGSTALLPGLTTQLSTVLHDSTEIRTDIDPSQVLSRGAAVQAGLLISLGPNDSLLAAFEDTSKALDAQVTTRAIGLSFPQTSSEEIENNWIDVIATETPLPARRTVSFVANLGEEEGSNFVGIEIWEAEKKVKVDRIKTEPDPEDEDEEEPEEIEVRERMTDKQTLLGSLKVPAMGSRSGKKKGPLQATIVLTAVATVDGNLEVMAHEKDSGSSPTVLQIFS